MSLIHKGSKLTFQIKKGSVHFTQKESYTTDTRDKSEDTFFGEAPLESDHLEDWMASVTKSWVNADSVRPEATADNTD